MKLCLNEATVMNATLEACIEAASAAGFEGVELWWSKVKSYLEDHSEKELVGLLVNYNIHPVSICPLRIWTFRDNEAAREEYGKALKTAAAIGCDMLIVCPDFQPASLTRDEAMKAHGEELKAMSAAAMALGVRLAIEPIGMHTLVPGPSEALELISRAGSPANVGLLVDSFHYFRSGITDKEIRVIPLEKLYIFHINDSADGTINELNDSDRVYPSTGILPLRRYIRLLQEKGYKGYVSVEMFNPSYWKDDVKTVGSKSYKYTNQLLNDMEDK